MRSNAIKPHWKSRVHCSHLYRKWWRWAAFPNYLLRVSISPRGNRNWGRGRTFPPKIRTMRPIDRDKWLLLSAFDLEEPEVSHKHAHNFFASHRICYIPGTYVQDQWNMCIFRVAWFRVCVKVKSCGDTKKTRIVTKMSSFRSLQKLCRRVSVYGMLSVV
jgi:hypothetical protein